MNRIFHSRLFHTFVAYRKRFSSIPAFIITTTTAVAGTTIYLTHTRDLLYLDIRSTITQNQHSYSTTRTMDSLPTPPAEPASNPPDLSSLPPFEMSFSLHLSCDACVQSVRSAVLSVPGILSAEPLLEAQTLTTRGTAAPSAIMAAVQSTGRDAIIRGTGTGNGAGEQAAVAILEDYDTDDYSSSPVRGLARIVQVASPESYGSAVCVVDVSLSGLKKGVYTASVRTSGDISRGSSSVGGSWKKIPGEIVVGDDGKGAAVFVGQGWQVWEAVGRGFAVERIHDHDNDKARMVLGVIARSAGVWDNDKMVCSCSGKTVWEERVEQKGRGML